MTRVLLHEEEPDLSFLSRNRVDPSHAALNDLIAEDDDERSRWPLNSLRY